MTSTDSAALPNAERVKNKYSNIRRAADLSNPFWDRAVLEGLADITADKVAGFAQTTTDDVDIHNFSTYSYLGLDTDDRIRAGAIEALERERTLNSSISRMRVHSSSSTTPKRAWANCSTPTCSLSGPRQTRHGACCRWWRLGC